MAKSSLRLWFSVLGPGVKPDLITQATGVKPTRSYRVGDRLGHGVKEVAAWEWATGEGGYDTGPLVSEMLGVLQPHESVFRAEAEAGAEVVLAIVGSVSGDPVNAEGEASDAGWYSGSGQKFLPFIIVEKPIIELEQPLLRFLHASRAEVTVDLTFSLASDEEVT